MAAVVDATSSTATAANGATSSTFAENGAENNEISTLMLGRTIERAYLTEEVGIACILPFSTLLQSLRNMPRTLAGDMNDRTRARFIVPYVGGRDRCEYDPKAARAASMPLKAPPIDGAFAVSEPIRLRPINIDGRRCRQ